MASAQLDAQSNEALTNGSPALQLSAISVEALSNSVGAPSRQLGAVTLESITDSAGPTSRQLAGLSVEVLVPSKLTFVGWGMPIKSSVWS